MKKLLALFMTLALVLNCVPMAHASENENNFPNQKPRASRNVLDKVLFGKDEISQDARFSESEVIIKVSLPENKSSTFSLYSEEDSSVKVLDLLSDYGIAVSDAETLMTLSDAGSGIGMSRTSVAGSHEELTLITLNTPGRDNVLDMVEFLKTIPEVEHAQPNFIRTADEITPNDEHFSAQYALSKIGAPLAWNTTTGSDNVVVAVIDSGIDYTHPNLAANIWTNTAEIPDNGIDDDYNGFVDDVYGWNFVSETNNPMDDYGQGTHVAGTIGAVGNNDIGIAGISWNVKLMPLKVLDSNGDGYDSNIIKGIAYAEAMDADISNNSYSSPGDSSALGDAVQATTHLFVAAAGNDSFNTDFIHQYPSNLDFDNVISVASTDFEDKLSPFSNYGVNSVDVAAPGSDILSTVPGGNYDEYSGTSMASPHVAGAAALLLANDPTLTVAELKERILLQGDVIPALEHKVKTGRRLNVYNSLSPVVHIDIESITLSSPAENITNYDVFTIAADISPANATRPQIIWSSSDPNVYIEDNGTVYVAYAASGSVTITATSAYNPSVFDTYTFTINPRNPSTDFAGGSGTEQNPYRVSTPEQLNNVRKYNDSPTYFVQTRNIDMGPATSPGGKYYNNGRGWIGIGSQYSNFAFIGHYSGNGYYIKNLNIDMQSEFSSLAGLFGLSTGSIEKVNLTGGAIKNGYYMGGIASVNLGYISDCTSSTPILVEENSMSAFVGGIVGKNEPSSSLVACHNYGSIEYRGFHGIYMPAFVGGIVGYNNASQLLLCGNSGDIIVEPLEYVPLYVGGIAGISGDFNFPKSIDLSMTIDNCVNSGDIYLNVPEFIYEGNPLGYFVGGIVGELDSSAMRNWDTRDTELSNCYNTGNITTENDFICMGGISGFVMESVIFNCFNSGNISSPSNDKAIYKGGITGVNFESQIDYTYNIGTISGDPTRVGHIVGAMPVDDDGNFYDFAVSYSYYVSGGRYRGIAGIADQPNVVEAKTAAQMKNPSTFSKWNFGYDGWRMESYIHGGYPYLVGPAHFVVTGTDSIALGSVPAGTAFNSLPLPDTVAVSYLNGLLGALPVNWKSSSYNPSTLGNQTISGSFDLSQYMYSFVLGTGGISPKATVTVTGAYTVTFDYQGVTKSGNTEKTRSVSINTAVGKLPSPTRIGYTFDGWYGSPNGKGTKYSSSTVIKSNTTMYANWTYITPPSASKQFDDIPETKWYAEAISFAVGNGLLKGMDDNSFEPNTRMNRAMFVTVLGRLAEQMGEKIPNSHARFSDVVSGSYYEKYVSWAADNKIVMGYEDGTFKPNNLVSREEAAVLLMRFIDYRRISLPEGKSKVFTDSASISNFAKTAVARATKAGILSGYEDGSFRPKNTSTRAEVAQVFFNFLTG